MSVVYDCFLSHVFLAQNHHHHLTVSESAMKICCSLSYLAAMVVDVLCRPEINLVLDPVMLPQDNLYLRVVLIASP